MEDPDQAFSLAMLLFAEDPLNTTSLSTTDPTPSSNPTTKKRKNKKNKNKPDWATLPKPIFISLLKHLDLRIDVPRVRSVCSTWRASLPLTRIPKLPLFFPAPSLPSPPSILPILFTTKYYLLSPSTGPHPHSPWIIRVADVSTQLNTNKYHLYSPVHLRDDYFHSIPPIKGHVSLLDCHVTELTSTFSIRGAGGDDSSSVTHLSEKVVGGWDLTSSHMFSALALVSNKNKNDNKHPAAAAAGWGGGNGGDLFFLKKMGEDKWAHIRDMTLAKGENSYTNRRALEAFDVADIAYYDGEFYAFDYTTWQVAIIDPTNTESGLEFIDGPRVVANEVIGPTRFLNVEGHVYAMKELHMVGTKGGEGLYIVMVVAGDHDVSAEGLIVYVLNEEELEWERVDDIGDHVFFIGIDVAFSVKSELIPKWKRGSVCLFSGMGTYRGMFDGYVELDKKEGVPKGVEKVAYMRYWKCFRLFEMENGVGRIVPFSKLSKEVYTGVFFPPPKWVKWTCGNKVVKMDKLKVEDDGDGSRDGGVKVKVGAAGAKGKSVKRGGAKKILEEVE